MPDKSTALASIQTDFFPAKNIAPSEGLEIVTVGDVVSVLPASLLLEDPKQEVKLLGQASSTPPHF